MLPAALYVELSASATIGDFDFTVTGRIPRLSSTETITFVLMLEVQGALNSVDPIALVSDLTSSGYQFGSGNDHHPCFLISWAESHNSCSHR